MSTPWLTLDGLSKSYGAVPALRGVSFTVGADELVVVLGATGAGKTTLLRCLAGLERPDGGRLTMAGDDITEWAPRQRDVAMVFQNFSLYPDWTVRRNLAFPLLAPGRRLPKAELDERVTWAAKLLRIEHLLERGSHQLSGGEMQRVAIGRAIVRRPRLFLFDEPLSNLDAKLREELRVELVLHRRHLGVPMLYVTHDQAEALSMADRIVVLADGQVLQSGTPEDLYRRPATPRVARLLGRPPINLFAARASGGWWRSADGTTLVPAPGVADQAMATVGIRPEDFELAGGAAAADIVLVEDKGAAKLLLVHWAGQEVHLLVPRQSTLKPGEQCQPRAVESHALVWPGTPDGAMVSA